MENKNKPEKKFRAGQITATIWSNKQKGKNDIEFDAKSVVIEKSFKDKEDEWQSTNSFYPSDLDKVLLVAAKAQEYLLMSKEKEED